MSVYLKQGKGWRYDFTLNGNRYTKAWFKTKKQAQRAEVLKREEVLNGQNQREEVRTDITFLELVEKRLDNVKTYNSPRHYQDYVYLAKRWVKLWGQLMVDDITDTVIEDFILERSQQSKAIGNKEIRYLRATFNFAKKKRLIDKNPLDGIEFFSENKTKRYVPPSEDINKVIDFADPDTQDYLWIIRDTLARVSEINHLKWQDVYFNDHYLVLYTRKKKGGHLTPREVPMTNKVFKILTRRYENRDPDKPWVFWHRYWSRKNQKWIEGPYNDRKQFMKTLCAKAGVKYFRFHALRHAGATVMENSNISIGTIQKILGHEKRSTTEIYLHNLGASDRQAMDVFEHAR